MKGNHSALGTLKQVRNKAVQRGKTGLWQRTRDLSQLKPQQPRNEARQVTSPSSVSMINAPCLPCNQEPTYINPEVPA